VLDFGAANTLECSKPLPLPLPSLRMPCIVLNVVFDGCYTLAVGAIAQSQPGARLRRTMPQI
jgi:hypothetical protein